jgi:putative membrane protein insertion efficiency factor
MTTAVSRILARPLIWFVRLYQLLVSPWLGANCRFQPPCSVYAIEALQSYGVLRGSWMAVRRIGRCHPWGGSGYDPVPGESDRAQDTITAEDLVKTRERILNHAYGFISRDNRDGGLQHIFNGIQDDPEPLDAWAWYFEQMMLWEDRREALFFAQHYIHDHLQHGEQQPAVKLIMRCRRVDERFRPRPEDMAAAIAACNACGNATLAAMLAEK